MTIDLSKGWVEHFAGYHLHYDDGLIKVSIVTGPPGSGVMGRIAPGIETTYEARFPGMEQPMGYLTLEEIQGVIRYLREKSLEEYATEL